MEGGRTLPPGAAAEMLEQLWRDPKARSRNSNFGRYRDNPGYRRAVHHVRSLLAFRQDLLRYRGESEVEVLLLSSGKAAQLTMVVPALSLRRTLFVSRLELELLRNDPAWLDAGVVFPNECDRKA